VAPEINTTWLGLVGPDVQRQGVNNWLWSDHTDIQPTMMELLGLHDDYTPDGRVLIEVVDPGALPPAVRDHYQALVQLGDVYTQLNAAVGQFGLSTLAASTKALASSSPGDATYTKIENTLTGLGNARDAIVAQLKAVLYGAEFGGAQSPAAAATGSPVGLVGAANGPLGQASALAG